MYIFAHTLYFPSLLRQRKKYVICFVSKYYVCTKLSSIFQFLWPFQSFSNSRGHHLLTAYMNRFKPIQELESNLNDESVRNPIVLKSATVRHIYGEKGDGMLPLKDIRFEWQIKPWSACSQTCGANGGGYRLRSAHCQMHMQNQTQSVDNNFCEDAGLSVPETVEKCGNVECPRWETTEWTQCAQSKCFALHTALQRRDVFCRFGNDTGGSSGTMCDENEMPVSKQECYSEKCKGVWRVEPWSEVIFDIKSIFYSHSYDILLYKLV